MARTYVLCLILALFAVAVLGQECDVPKVVEYGDVLSADGAVTILADTLGATLTGTLSLVPPSSGGAKISIEYTKGQGFAVATDSASSEIKITKTTGSGASRLSGLQIPLAIGLALLALVSQRGSFAVLAVVAVAALAVTLVSAACDTNNTVNITIEVDQAQLSTATIKVPATSEGDATITIDTAASRDQWEALTTKACSGTACTYVFSNNLYGCSNECGTTTTNVASFQCNAGTCQLTCASGFLNCDGAINNGCEASANEITTCGSCTNDCSGIPNVAAPVCTDGQCHLACTSGFFDCDGQLSTGCEVDLNSDEANCGACNNNCDDAPNVIPGAQCVLGVCNYTDSCATGYADCDPEAAGCESDVSSDQINCGACGNTCGAAPNTVNPSCSNSSCVYTCEPGFNDCDPATPGCESDEDSDVNNCGACGNNCATITGSDPLQAGCGNGTCTFACAGTNEDCDNTADNGCEVDLSTDGANCGACGTDCSALPGISGDATCTAGVCSGYTCAAGFDNCAGSVGVGCPDNLASNVANCGTCGIVCSETVANVNTVTCANATCGYDVCATGFQDCNADTTDGCESETATDINNCGDCSTDCEVSGSSAGKWISVSCNAAGTPRCQFTCQAGFADCDGDFTNGCETNLTSINNCGSCGRVCSFTNAVPSCNAAGQCIPACNASYSQCSATPIPDTDCTINLNTDADNCGSCGNDCSVLPNVQSGITCSSGVCDTANNCAAGYGECNGLPADGCELSTAVCRAAAAGGECSIAGAYSAATAWANLDCSTLVASNAALNLASDSVCAVSGANAGICVLDCTPGTSDCDGDPRNGCEATVTMCGSSLTQGQGCQTALQDPSGGPVSCLALKDPLQPTISGTIDQSQPAQCDNTDGRCDYTCAATHYDCDASASNGCEIAVANCPQVDPATDCTFNTNSRCGSNVCADCSLLSGTDGSGVCTAVGSGFECTVNCDQSLCRNIDGDWANGCESAQAYTSVGIAAVDCSADIDLTNVATTGRIYCDGDSTSATAGRCLFTCKPGFADCDGSPLNGCETDLSGPCTSCSYQSDTSCGKNKCIDCTLLEGTLGVDYANPRHASASASTCVAVDSTVDRRITDFVCDTSVHRLHPRFDPPTGDNGACQSELCRDLDGDWTNGCESAQLYGRGRRYDYGDNYNVDAFMVPYVPNPYEARFGEYKLRFQAMDRDTAPSNDILADIDFFIENAGIDYQLGSTFQTTTSTEGVLYSGFPASRILLNYQSVPDPAVAAKTAIIGEPYENPLDCILSEWSDWGLCAFEDDCTSTNFWMQSRIRTRQVVRQASGGGVCHLPLVEDFYRFAHNSRDANSVSGVPFPDANLKASLGTYATGADGRHGGGFEGRIDYSAGSGTQPFDVRRVNHFNPTAWFLAGSVEHLDQHTNYATASGTGATELYWTGDVVAGQGDLSATVVPEGRLLTCAAPGSCPDFTQGGIVPLPCNISAWSEWSSCSASCDGDWAGGVRIRTRHVNRGAYAGGLCFADEFDEATGEALHPWSGLLFQEDWQCNDHSCSSFNCLALRNATLAAALHIYVGADAVAPQCDGRDWPEYVGLNVFIDNNHDGIADFSTGIYTDFKLYETIHEFTYEYRWPGHCLYECEEGWYDCDHDPRNGCETTTDHCTIDAEFGSVTTLKHPMQPWVHPHGECSLAWKHEESGVVSRWCEDTTRFPEYTGTVGRCDSNTGHCDLSCAENFGHCPNEVGCVPINIDSSCGLSCADCSANSALDKGASAWSCQRNAADTDFECTYTTCATGCHDLDGDRSNGCEVAEYVGVPYPDVEPFDAVLEEWSSWSPCIQSDDCGFRLDVFRHVPIQTRYRRPLRSAYNGGKYEIFTPDTSVVIDDETGLENVLGHLLVSTEYYESRVCVNAPTPCIECTNQLADLEVPCELSEWSRWSTCSAECNGGAQPYQMRTRTVVTPASLGGRCPPPGDTWQLAEMQATLGAVSSIYAKASYLVDVRKCNSDPCSYQEDCDALNHFYPGHFSEPAHCETAGADVSRCSSLSGTTECSVANGYCNGNNDLRDGCESYVYPTHCGRVNLGTDTCDYDSFRDCTTLPGVTSPFAAPCVPETSSITGAAHKCDLTWACNSNACIDLERLGGAGWFDGCEVARNYSYPFVNPPASASAYSSNPVRLHPDVAAGDEKQSHLYFVDRANPDTYTPSNPRSFDCQYFLNQGQYCAVHDIGTVSNADGPTNKGCHLKGSSAADAATPLAFGCDGVRGVCTFNCEDNYCDADGDPRNGCETDLHHSAGPEDKFVWAGKCSSCNAKSQTSCGADLCIDCTQLPGIDPANPPQCVLVEEKVGSVPVLKTEGSSNIHEWADYNSIQYACGVLVNTNIYRGEVDFDNAYCTGKCFDGDKDWKNGCEQGRGYTGTASGYNFGAAYDSLFDKYDWTAAATTATNLVSCSVDYSDTEATNPCDPRSSGFTYPTPGAWYYTDMTPFTGDSGETRATTNDVTEHIDRVTALNANPANTNPDVVGPDMLANRAYDCSWLYRTEKFYTLDPSSGEYVYSVDSVTGAATGTVTFATAFHIDNTTGLGTSVCNRMTGLCNYRCAAGWADFDLDPSNGCEADLSGPCGQSTARKYDQASSCGWQCNNCSPLPGSYSIPQATSECYLLDPAKMLFEKFQDQLVRQDELYVCSTEIVRPLTSFDNHYINLVCDPRECYDADWEYENGCEQANQYPKAWAKNNGGTAPTPNNITGVYPNGAPDGALGSMDYTGTNTRKYAFLHHDEEKQFWVREDGLLVLGGSSVPDSPGNWDAAFRLDAEPFLFEEWTYAKYNDVYKAYSGKDFDAGTFTSGTNQHVDGAAYDCSNAYIFSSTTSTKSYEYSVTTAHPGPWYHVNQTKGSQCFPGWNPGADFNRYSAATLTRPCPGGSQSSTTTKACYDTWTQVTGHGKCALQCEQNWGDCDGDPSNGCESYMLNNFPYPNSNCGTYCVTGAAGPNYSKDFSCGAGACLNCVFLGGVVHQTGVSVCKDGGADWIAADNSIDAPSDTFTPTSGTAVGYPSDYYCTDIINQDACARAVLSYPCSYNSVSCPESALYSGSDEALTTSTAAVKLQVCKDVDKLWETGCELALGYNLGATVDNAPMSQPNGNPGETVTIVGHYRRHIGVRPNWDKDFKEITWTGAQAGFDCEVLRALPRAHTHVTPQKGVSNPSVIECSTTTGVCIFQCDSGWKNCDGNPWNGCETLVALCGGGSGGSCETAQRYLVNNQLQTLQCSTQLVATELSRRAFCDGGRIPFDEWHAFYAGVDGSTNNNDASVYDDYLEIIDHGIDHVDVEVPVPIYSRYTIKGYWDNAEIDASCRVWTNLGTSNIRTNIPVAANHATGKCAVDCDEANGYSDCDGNDFNACESHLADSLCRSTTGACVNCRNLPGTISLRSKCLPGSGNAPITDLSLVWPAGFGTPDGHTVVYASASVGPINAEFPQCDTRGQSANDAPNNACDDTLCRDYDGDWENGCEFPMKYTQAQRDSWEVPEVVYNSNGTVSVDGFDCSWISDPQPDAGGRNYGGKTWAQKYHVNLATKKGYCNGASDSAAAGKCDFACEAGWQDCDGDPSNGCETDTSLCGQCVFALGYPDGVPVNCTTLVDPARGFVPFASAPTCNGREGQDGLCREYFCNIFDGFCDSGLGQTLTTTGCVDQTTDDAYCGADWNHRALSARQDTVNYDNAVQTYKGSFMLDYSVFDSTGRCGSCSNLGGYQSSFAFCQEDSVVAGHTFDGYTYYKPTAVGEIDNALGEIRFDTMGNTVGDYLCQLHGEIGVADDGACDRNLCVDEDYYWANGCETAVNYPRSVLSGLSAGAHRDEESGNSGFDYHFAYNSEEGKLWPGIRTQNRGVWCPFLQFWSLATDNYISGDCDVFPCPHFAASTVDSWVTCVNNATSPLAGKCNFVCNAAEGWNDCDNDPLTGCETDVFNDGTCGSNCERIECNTLGGINPYYWSECIDGACDLSVCEDTLCRNNDGNWTNGCELAVNYPGGQTYDCTTYGSDPALHLRKVSACVGEPGHHMAGKCEFECEPGWIDCDGDFSNGCEHDGSLCQDCTHALGYVTVEGGADGWETLAYYEKVYQNFTDKRGLLHDEFAGPEVVFAEHDNIYVAAFDCASLATTYPGHFDTVQTPIRCDADASSPTAGRCVYSCNNAAGYFDCDGDPRNGCEHESLHEACGAGGKCRNCYLMSGVNYAHYDGDATTNLGLPSPYTRAGDGIYKYIPYRGISPTDLTTLNSAYTPATNNYALGCIKGATGTWACNLASCDPTICKNTDNNWINGCEVAQKYDFNGDNVLEPFDCSLMGPTPATDAPRVTTDYTLPSFHVLQVVGTVGCDRNVQTGGSGAWNPAISASASGDVLPGHCYYECEEGFRDCDGDPRNGCEVDLRACRDDNNQVGWDYTAKAPTDGCELALGYTEAELGLGQTTFSCNHIFGGNNVDLTKPIYCRAGQDGQAADGKCQFSCMAGYVDCDGNPTNGCEAQVGDASCSCVNCLALPGTQPKSSDPASPDYTISSSVCQAGSCTLPCDNTLCVDADGQWENGCEQAQAYTTTRVGESIGLFSCNVWHENPLLAKKQHVDITSPAFCDGRAGSINAGLCEFTCESPANGGVRQYQDCDGDPRNGCEETTRWCTVGQAATDGPRATASDRCSKAMIYFCDANGLDSLGQPCENPATGLTVTPLPASPSSSFDCWNLLGEGAEIYNVDNTTVVPYCDRDPSHIETRGDCVFNCKAGFADCDNLATNGCEASTTALTTCTDDCINCQTLSGIDTNAAYACNVDPVTNEASCTFSCPAGNCADEDGDWRNGCEVAKNVDIDVIGLFMNEGQEMDCSIMQLEAQRNPDLFYHHLHIDLTKEIDTSLNTKAPAGTIFCNGGLKSPNSALGIQLGNCYFECVDGFFNENRYSYDGCEQVLTSPTYPYTWGGYRIGHPIIEEFLDFICASAPEKPAGCNGSDNLNHRSSPTPAPV